MQVTQKSTGKRSVSVSEEHYRLAGGPGQGGACVKDIKRQSGGAVERGLRRRPS